MTPEQFVGSNGSRTVQGAGDNGVPMILAAPGFAWIDAALDCLNEPGNVMHFRNNLQEAINQDPMRVFHEIAMPVAKLKASQTNAQERLSILREKHNVVPEQPPTSIRPIDVQRLIDTVPAWTEE